MLGLAGRAPEGRLLVGDEQLYAQLAEAEPDGRLAPTPPLWPPLQVHILRLLLGVGGFAAVFTAQLVLFGFVAFASWRLANRALGPRAGLVALAFVVVNPVLASYVWFLWPELLHLALVLGVLLLLLEPVGIGRAFAIGTLAGLAVLTKSLFGPLLPVLAVTVWWKAGAGRRLTAGLAVALALAAVVGPFVVERARFDPGATGIGPLFNILIALREGGRDAYAPPDVAWVTYRAMERSGDDWATRRSWVLGALREEVRGRSMVAEVVDRLARHPFRVLDWRSELVAQLPGGPRSNAGAGYQDTPAWLVGALRWWSGVISAALLTLAGFGIAAASWRDRLAPRVLVVLGGWQVGLLLVVHAIARYRVQLEVVLVVLAAAGVVGLGGAARRPRRLVVGGVLGVILLACAFAGPWLDGALR